MALEKAKNYQSRGGDRFNFPMATGAKIFKGAMVVLSGGFAKAGFTGLGLVAVGIAENGVWNEGLDGAERINTRKDEIYPFINHADDPMTLADVGSDCFIVDDETVARTDGAGTRSVAGIIRDIEDNQVWIEFK